MDKPPQPEPEWTPKFRRRVPIAVILRGDEAVRAWLADRKRNDER